MSMDRRSFIAGLAALATTGVPSIAGPLIKIPAQSEIDKMAQFAEIWARLDDDQKAVCLTLLRALSVLPEGESSDHLFAEADLKLSELRQLQS